MIRLELCWQHEWIICWELFTRDNDNTGEEGGGTPRSKTSQYPLINPSLVLWSLSWNNCRSIFHSWITISMFETIFWWHSTTFNIDLLFQVSQQRTHVQLEHQPGNCMKYFWLKYFLIVMLSGCNKLCGDVSILLVLNHAQNSATQSNWYHTDAGEIFWCRRHLWSWATMKNEIIQHWALMTSVGNAVDIDHIQWSYQDIRLATQRVV